MKGTAPKTVYVLLRQENQYVETGSDAYSTSSMVLADVFESEEDAQHYLDEKVRQPLHRECEIEEREVKSFDQ
jgi:hypothetical protein